MIRLLIAALLLLVAVPAAVAAEPECYSLDKAYQRIDALIAEHGGKRETLEGKPAQDYLDVVNEIPPATHFASKLIVLWEREKIVGIGVQREDGMVCVAGHVGAAIHDRAIKAALGTDS